MTWNSIDKTGQKFNMLTAIERIPNYKSNGKTYYKCLCDCGNFHCVSNDNLEKTYSCGCTNIQALFQRIDYTVQKFNSLTVTSLICLPYTLSELEMEKEILNILDPVTTTA